MRFSINILIILSLACAAESQVWPGGALCGSETGQPCSPAGHLSFRLAGAMLKSDHWRDQRSRFAFDIGLGKGIGLSVAGSTRYLRGYGAFEKGMEDTRLGLSFWPSASRLSIGVNGYLIIPTGYRKSQTYYDDVSRQSLSLPEMTLGQSGGELFSGAKWTLGPAAELNVFGGYFCTSDRTEQAFRWGLGTKLLPFGESCWAELNVDQSITRVGTLPNTETLEAAIPFHAFSGLTVVPALWADLNTEPLYGLSLGLRFSSAVKSMQSSKPAVIISPARVAGVVLVPPPLTDIVLADGKELWQSIQDGVGTGFDVAKPLATLDLPGLPFNDKSAESLGSSIRAIAQAHPDADWLLITRVLHEDVSRQRGINIPLMVSRPVWAAQCRLKIQFVNLRTENVTSVQIVEGTALMKDNPQLAVLSSGDDTVLSMNASRRLTFEAYKNAGQVIARELVAGRK